ncbi:MAG TPA: protoporphyrinogen oxidase [Vicinamibacterales bacterium]|nr:protoporphyrinogen oxidase [Vicinamibacterales bacterium]
MKSIVVAGGGVAGLSIAYAIRKRDPGAKVTVLEQRSRPGGNIRSEVVDGYTCEWGPDGFLDNVPETLALVKDLGIEGALRPSMITARRRYIFRRGRLHEVPASPLTFLTTGLLSFPGKLRVFAEPFAGKRPSVDETIHDFAARRIGGEAAAVMVDSMVSGIFAGNARTLSLRACFPTMWQLETDYGSLVRALIATRNRRTRNDAAGAPAGRLTSFDGGMEDLVRALSHALGSSLRTSARVTSIRRRPSGVNGPFSIATSAGALEADAVILTGPASESAEIIRPFDAALASLLLEIPTAPLAVVCLGYDQAVIAGERGPLDGFGFLVPRSENIRLLGALWETSIYPKRAPEGKALIRAMIGGALDHGAVQLEDDELVGAVRADLRTTMGLEAGPEFVRIIRHPRGIPQYDVGHRDRLQQIEALLESRPGLFLAGNSYRGVSINSCIAEAGPIAERALAYTKL